MPREYTQHYTRPPRPPLHPPARAFEAGSSPVGRGLFPSVDGVFQLVHLEPIPPLSLLKARLTFWGYGAAGPYNSQTVAWESALRIREKSSG